MGLKHYFTIDSLKKIVVFCTVFGLLFSVVSSSIWPAFSYYLLPARAWELMFGGIAFLYPVSLENSHKKALELTGITLIILSYFFISSEYAWPGYLALFPVVGTYLVIISNQQNSFLTNNFIFQSVGRWSYSIYLWHWPIVVFGINWEISDWWVYGFFLTLICGYLSYRFIESIRWERLLEWSSVFKIKPLIITIPVFLLACVIVIGDGFLKRFNTNIRGMYRARSHFVKKIELFRNTMIWMRN